MTDLAPVHGLMTPLPGELEVVGGACQHHGRRHRFARAPVTGGALLACDRRAGLRWRYLCRSHCLDGEA
jgi:hypothetical protein